MKSINKNIIINDTVNEIEKINNSVMDDNDTYFDYDTVIQLLEKAKSIMINTMQHSKPSNIPGEIPWSENMNPESKFDPYVFDGTMSVEDFKMAQKLHLESISNQNK